MFDNVRLRFGIENLFNREPPRYGRDPENTTGMYGGYRVTPPPLGAIYDINGRRFYLGARISF